MNKNTQQFSDEKTVTLSDGRKFTVTSRTDKMTSFTYSSVDDVRKDWVRFLTGLGGGNTLELLI